jgi:hypothetical protein
MLSKPWLAFLLLPVAAVHAGTEPTFNLKHADMAKCWAFYSWESSTTENRNQADSLAKAAARVRAHLFEEIGQETGSAMLMASMHTWEYLSSVVSDAEWERIAKVLHPSCLAYQ